MTKLTELLDMQDEFPILTFALNKRINHLETEYNPKTLEEIDILIEEVKQLCPEDLYHHYTDWYRTILMKYSSC